jgi:hypothetical protein
MQAYKGGTAFVHRIGTGGDATSINISGFTSTGDDKFALSYEDGDQSVSYNGAAVVTGSVTISQSLSHLYIGGTPSGSVLNAKHIKQLQYYPRRLTNTQLQALSA